MRKRWRGITHAWDVIWFRAVDGLPLGLVRIAFGAVALAWTAALIPLVPRYYADSGEFPIEGARLWGEEMVSRLLMPDALGSARVTYLVVGALVLGLSFLLVGLATRAAAAAVWLLIMWLQFRNPTYMSGGAELLRLTAFYLCLAYFAVAPSERALSLDRWRSRTARSKTRIAAWPLRLFQLQLALVYLTAGFRKVLNPSWWDGSAVYYALGPDSALPIPGWPWLRPFAVIVTLAIAWWELLFPVLVWLPATRVSAVAFGVASAIVALAIRPDLGLLPLALFALYPALLDAEATRQLWRRMRGAAAVVWLRSGRAFGGGVS